MKRILAITTLTTALLAPQAASAKIVELGGAIPKAAVSCPENCQAVGRVTGYQGRGATVAKPFVIPRKGKVIAFTVRLGKPDANQVKFFNDLYGNDPQVQLSILRRSDKRKTYLDHRLVAQSPPSRQPGVLRDLDLDQLGAQFVQRGRADLHLLVLHALGQAERPGHERQRAALHEGQHDHEDEHGVDQVACAG